MILPDRTTVTTDSRYVPRTRYSTAGEFNYVGYDLLECDAVCVVRYVPTLLRNRLPFTLHKGAVFSETSDL